MDGVWTSTTGPNGGVPFRSTKAFGGYDAFIPWWGQTSIGLSGGKFGSHIQVVGKKDSGSASCYYNIEKLGRKKMAWNLVSAETGECPGSIVFEKSEDQHAEETVSRGQNDLKQEDYDTAIAEFNAAIAADPEYAPAYSGLGQAHYAKKQYDPSIADFSRAIRLSPSSSVYWNLRGNSYYSKGDYPKAIADYSDAILLDNSDPSYYGNRGYAYFYLKQLESALRDFNESLRLNPQYQFAIDGLSKVKKELALIELMFCNDSPYPIVGISVAGSRESDQGATSVAGWWNADAGKCVSIGRYLRSEGIWYAFYNPGTNTYSGDTSSHGRPLCVKLQKYDHVVGGNCYSGEDLLRFIELDFGPDQRVKTVNAR